MSENTNRWIKQYVEIIPVPLITPQNHHIVKKIENVVDKILDITKTNDYLKNSAKQAKVHGYERQIDQLVYKLYGLTPEEIKIVENYER